MYELTEHARDALDKRRIRVEWMERVLASPTRVESDEYDASLEHRLGTVEDFGNRVLRVIVNVATDPPRIVTLYFDRDMRGKL